MLHGVSVLVAGAGLAGLTAARDLVALGATVTVIDARDRVGGRVLTMRNGFAGGQHAEAGGDMIDESHAEILQLAHELGLQLVQILKTGWADARPDEHGVVRKVARDAAHGWERLAAALGELTRSYRLAERRWDTPITQAIARQTVLQWLDESQAGAELRATAEGLRGFFLADPDELSLIALVDQFASHGRRRRRPPRRRIASRAATTGWRPRSRRRLAIGSSSGPSSSRSRCAGRRSAPA